MDKSGLEIHLNCANWKGSQMDTFVPYGLDKAPLDFISKSIAAFGFNCVRLPYSLQLYFTNPVVADSVVSKNVDMKTQTG